MKNNPNSHIEMYDEGRYFTMTGNHVEGTPTWICYRQEELKAVHAKYILKPEAPKESAKAFQPVSLADDELIRKAIKAENGEKFKKLWEGDSSDYPSQSEAEIALCCHLAFWAAKDPVRIDKLFRESGLMREKWERRDYRESTIKRAVEQTKEVYSVYNRETHEVSTPFPDMMSGVAGRFAELYSSYLEAPKHFFFVSFLACLGSILSNRLTLRSEIRPQPRLYVILLGESGDVRKSTAILKTIHFFQDTLMDMPVSWGVSSAEGLQAKLQENAILLLVYDEFKTFVSKCRVEGSVLLPMCTTLFEANRYESRTKSSDIKLDGVFLSILAASTVNTYERVFDSNFADIGMTNRLFICPGDSERKYSLPLTIPEDDKKAIGKELAEILEKVGDRKELTLTQDAREHYDRWYMTLDRSVHAKRLDVYALRFMTLFAANEMKNAVDVDTVRKATALMDWQLQVRQLYDPIDSDTQMGKVEERIRRVLKAGARSERELKQITHASRSGLWFFNKAKENLLRGNEMFFDKKSKLWTATK